MKNGVVYIDKGSTERNDIPEHDVAKGDYFDEDPMSPKQKSVWIKTGGNSIQANNNPNNNSQTFYTNHI